MSPVTWNGDENVNEEEFRAYERDLFWNRVEDMLLLTTSAITILALVALVVIQITEWMS